MYYAIKLFEFGKWIVHDWTCPWTIKEFRTPQTLVIQLTDRKSIICNLKSTWSKTHFASLTSRQWRRFSIKFKLNETYWTLKWKMTICGLSNTVPTIHHNLHSLRQSLSFWSPKGWKLFNEALFTRNCVFQKIYYNDFVLWMFHLEGNQMLW